MCLRSQNEQTSDVKDMTWAGTLMGCAPLVKETPTTTADLNTIQAPAKKCSALIFIYTYGITP